jgi:hypothetical protein
MIVKCAWCKEKNDKTEMFCEEKETGKFNKNGTEKKIRKYFHQDCYDLYKKDKEVKKIEAEKWDNLYQFLLKLHSLDVLDARMIEKLQDLRNGTIKIHNKKIRRYKQGVTYELMLQTYEYIIKRIDYVLLHNSFKTKWNEFSYVFGMIINNINEVKMMNERNKIASHNNKKVTESDNVEITFKNRKKKDELDISDLL